VIEKIQEGAPKVVTEGMPTDSSAFQERRSALKKFGRFAAVTVPAVTLLLAASTKPAKAPCISCVPSSRQFKTTGEGIDAVAVLGGVAGLTVERWRYKPETGMEQQSHIGPYAEDFRAAFGVGDGVTISTIDAIGVCLGAIKALSAKVESLEAELHTVPRKKAA
jgi:hypothetical protein